MVCERSEVSPDERTTAEEPRAKTAAVLVVERDQPDRPLWLNAALDEKSNCVLPCEDTERTVKPSAVRHRIEVRTNGNRLARPCLPAADQVSTRIDLYAEPELAQPSGNVLVGCIELGRPGEPGHAGSLAAETSDSVDVDCQITHAE